MRFQHFCKPPPPSYETGSRNRKTLTILDGPYGHSKYIVDVKCVYYL